MARRRRHQRRGHGRHGTTGYRAGIHGNPVGGGHRFKPGMTLGMGGSDRAAGRPVTGRGRALAAHESGPGAEQPHTRTGYRARKAKLHGRRGRNYGTSRG